LFDLAFGNLVVAGGPNGTLFGELVEFVEFLVVAVLVDVEIRSGFPYWFFFLC
jgi:hypothetical protein